MGEDFYGREEELQRAVAMIQGNNLMLAAPRRVGKTSFAHRLMDTLGASGWNTIFIDLEKITGIAHFFRIFHDELVRLPEVSLSDKLKSKARKWLEDIELSASAMSVAASFKVRERYHDDFTTLAELLNTLERPTLIVFDELTVLLESLLLQDDGEREVRTFLNQFRALRTSTAGRCCWMICSSVGVRNFTTQHNMSDTINDVADFELGAYSDAEARSFIAMLARDSGINLSPATADYLLRKIGWNIPFFIQLLLSRLSQGDAPVAQGDVDAAYAGLLMTGSFDTWYERLNKEYGNRTATAKVALRFLCVHVDGMPRADIQNYLQANFPSLENDDLGLLLRALMTDGYLAKDGENYRFRSPLLRDYWKMTYCS